MQSMERRFKRPLRRIGVDEVSYGKGQQKYLTVVWNHDRSEVVWIGKGRESATLEAFFAKLGRRRSRRLQCITMDMAQSYISAASVHAPQADLLRSLPHRTAPHGGRQRSAKTGVLATGRPSPRGDPRQEVPPAQETSTTSLAAQARLDALLALNRRLFRAYVLKEQFDHAWVTISS